MWFTRTTLEKLRGFIYIAIVAIAGIAFADVLMFLQLGIREALFDGAVQLHNSLEGEIVLVSSRYKTLISLDQFSQRRLYQALGFMSKPPQC